MFSIRYITFVVEVRTFFRTSLTRSASDIITVDRNQVLRFDVTQATIYPSCINDE